MSGRRYEADISIQRERKRRDYGGFLVEELELIFNTHMDLELRDWSLDQLYYRVRKDENSPYVVEMLNNKRHLFLK